MKINGLIKKARWEKIKCSCDHNSVMTEYPVIDCIHCKCQESWESVPQKDFKIIEFDKKTKKKTERTIKEISLVRGSKLQDVMGWKF